ncbi:MAG: FAD-dependent oxidoreductase, partial [Planctomycetota bacterium]
VKELHQFELLPKPPESRTPEMLWPTYPRIYQKSTSHEEGCIQRWNVLTKRFTGTDGRVTGLEAIEVDWSQPDENGRRQMTEHPGTEFQMRVDLVILALGFLGPRRSSLLQDLGVELTEAGLVKTDASYQTSTAGVFCAGDMEVGPSHVVRAISAGQEVAESIDRMLSQA